MQLEVHLCESLLHVLDVVGSVADEIRTVSPVRTEDAYLIIRTERSGE